MSYLSSYFTFSLIATFLLGALISWVIWGRNQNKHLLQLAKWRDRYNRLDKEYQSIASEFSILESELNMSSKEKIAINDEKNTLIGKLTASKALLNKADKEIDHLKKQLGQTTEHLQITSEKLEEHKLDLNTLQNASNETHELKALLGEATKHYNRNGLKLKNKQEQYTALENKFNETNKRMNILDNELEHMRTRLLNRDKEFENQVVLFSDLQNQHDEKNKSFAALQEELTALQLKNQDTQKDDQIASLQNELHNSNHYVSKFKEEINTLKSNLPKYENTVKKRDATISALENEITRLSKEIPPLQDKLESRDEQIETLQREKQSLQKEIPALQDSIQTRDAQLHELEAFIRDVQKEKSSTTNGNANINAVKNGAMNGNEKSNGHVAAVTKNNNVVHINGNGKTNGHAVNSTDKNAESEITEKNNAINGKSSTHDKNTKSRIKSYGLNKPTRKPDDLKLISGVGDALEKTLHKCGIYYFEQIAGFTRKDVSAVDNMLNFKGRIDRDEWIKQAKILLRGGTYTRKKATQNNKPRKRRTKPLGMKRPSGQLDDLQLINGVGPKLEKKLHRLGIYHYEQIAEFTADDIELLDSKLKTYRGRVKRDKWPMQARRLHKEFHVNT